MAAELFKPFVIRKLIERGIVKTVKSAKKLVDRKEAVVWDILENILKGHPIYAKPCPYTSPFIYSGFPTKIDRRKSYPITPIGYYGIQRGFRW
jgi:DNA-directed RNA polymerase subunit beta'